ncbi:hypothetical protein A5721_26190 [Mycobacterium vulneris]|nr:hypothetical protein A5721_26190 [Mycolicibacterium vulneris]
MAKFRASKAYHFSTDGTDKATWAKFVKVAGSDPVVFEFETSKPADVAKLRKLIKGDPAGYTDIAEVDEDKPERGRSSGSGDAGQGGDAGGDSGSAGGDAGGSGDANGS